MAEPYLKVWQRWPRLVQLSAGVILGAATIAGLYLTLVGIPKPVPPSVALFEPVDTQQVLAESRPELSSFDFIFRPLFSTRRRAPEPPPKTDSSVSGEVTPAADARVVRTMEGSRLLGIFGSGEVEGAIVRLDNGQRRRLVVGDRLDGWVLQSVSAREIRFVSDAGEFADLDMILSQSQQPLIEQKAADTRPEQEVVEKGDATNPEDQGSTEKQAAAKPKGFTFDSMYRDRYREVPSEEGEVGVEKP